MTSKKVVIIGAGPTGLGAAYRLHELGYENWILYEKSDYVGGHASSHVDERGFVWDEGGHVIFSHYPYFDRLIDQVLGEEVHKRVRESWIVKGESWVPYPFQSNLRYLPKDVQVSCLVGAAKAAANGNARAAGNLRDWILGTFGEGIAEAFMFPYNSKVWTTPLEQMSKSWIADRVAVLDFKRLLDASQGLAHNNLLVVGLGLKKKIETSKCWIYFTDPEMPCYRATHFSNYSPFNVPNGDTEHYSSVMCEMSFRVGESPDPQKILDQVTTQLIRTNILEESDRGRVVSRYHRTVGYSYPIPTLGRDRALAVLQPALLEKGIYSRGRFGAWRYEIGNMDHSVLMGVEAVNHIVGGEKELVFHSS